MPPPVESYLGRRRRVSPVWVMALVGLALVACGGNVPARDDAGSAGDGSGHLLRFEASAGESKSARMTMDMAMRITVGGQEAPRVDVPLFETTMDITIDDVGEQIDSSFTYRDVQTAGGDPQMRQQMQQAVAGMEGMSGTVSLTSRGELVDATIDTPTGLDPTLASFVDQIEQQLGQLTVPFPEGPVEVGGSWTSTTSFEVSGVTSTIEADYTLREFEGNTYVIDVEYVQTTEPGPIEGPDGQVVGEIVEGRSEGTGTLEGTLDFPFPTRGTTSTSGTVEMLVRSGGSQQEMVQDIEMTMRLEPTDGS